ncbi:S41 family peptidase [Candidatus Gottesmanbacteria bacterium]|nr:S41 family peptidase [Candidatus Gottesmanbacteria bacterium]
MRTLPFSKLRNFFVTLALLIFVGASGYELGLRRTQLRISPDKQVVVGQESPPQLAVDFSLFWDVWQRLLRHYIDAANLNKGKMVEGAITGMVNSLGDPYTVFLPPKENTEFKQDLGGAFEGIGAQLGMKDGHVIVVAPLKGNPAEKAGMKAGDFIVKVNGEETIGWTLPQAVSKIRGPRGTTVTLNILHEGGTKPVDITIIRDTITVPSVEWWVRSPREIPEVSGVKDAKVLQAKTGKVAYLRLSRFGDHSNDEWNKAVGEILAAQAANGTLKGLIFDLRNNPGGYLQGAVFIASEFMKSGTVVSQVNSDGTRENYPVDRVGKLLDIPVIVLINKGSASAAEIVAGALRDYKRATIVGETSFGKGSVQTPQDLTGGAGLHITTGKWLLPKGDWINKKGIVPDVLVPMESTDATSDAQLAKAVELLLK